MNSRRNGRIIALLTAVIFFATAAAAFAADGAQTTKISGVTKKYRKSYTKTLKDKISVTPAYGRTIVLSVYNPYQKRWETQAVYRTANTRSAGVTIRYPSVWKAYGKATWRITAPAAAVRVGNATKQLKAKSVTVTTRNKFTKAKAAVVLDAKTGKCVYAYNATEKRKVASMTKMMTMILLAEHKAPGDRVTINKEATKARKMSGGMGLKEGDVLTVKDLMYCSMLPSANDAAAAAAVGVSGSQKAFSVLMKKKAESLGATDSTYKYAFGDWHGNARSTAFDQALIGREFMTSSKTAFLRKVVKTRDYSFRTKKKKIRYSVTSRDAGNLILGQKGSVGIKTGYNPPAGRCFTNAWYYKGRLYISVIMGEPSADRLWKDVKKLTDVSNYLVSRGSPQVLVKNVGGR